jgi:hypothetical protein
LWINFLAATSITSSILLITHSHLCVSKPILPHATGTDWYWRWNG